ncbi:tudor domain-containing protein 6-like [Harmonia axyridis]|uniref:tudor domain-containing protein 6-like n=1 Tax=Harmonia axyridis TaxID=115357 RepID=UPI001E277EBF|nr:tudor domain-containing protein 6-like [Harmonia axyridis]
MASHEKTVGCNNIIPNFFDKVDWNNKDVYHGFVTNVYDPSKFWMRFAEVGRLQDMLREFYQVKKNSFALTPDVIHVNMYCAALDQDGFHRAKVVRVDLREPTNFIVFYIDHGIIKRLHFNKLYGLHEQFGAIPALAVRCVLANVAPVDNENWSSEAVRRFSSITGGEKQLGVRISNMTPERKVLEVYLVDPSVERGGRTPTVNHHLISQNLAKNIWHLSNQPPAGRVYTPLMKYMYLYPIHEAIENGTAPSTWQLTENLKECVAWDVLFPELFKYTPPK